MFILGYGEVVLTKIEDSNITKIVLLSKSGKTKIMEGFISFSLQDVYTNYIDINQVHGKKWLKKENIKSIKYLKITSLKGFSSSSFVLTCSLLGL